MYKLDRTAFKMGNHQEAEDNLAYWQNQSMEERLRASMYLNSVAYNFDIQNPPRIDKTLFSMRKH
jgi:hypothetical protein